LVGLFHTGCEHNDRGIGFAADFPGNIQTIHSGQVEVEENQVWAFMLPGRETAITAVSGEHVKASLFQIRAEHFDELGLIFDN
jgi:hypothetical protein